MERCRARAGNELGEKGGAAIAEALKANDTVHTLYLVGAWGCPRLRVGWAWGCSEGGGAVGDGGLEEARLKERGGDSFAAWARAYAGAHAVPAWPWQRARRAGRTIANFERLRLKMK